MQNKKIRQGQRRNSLRKAVQMIFTVIKSLKRSEFFTLTIYQNPKLSQFFGQSGKWFFNVSGTLFWLLIINDLRKWGCPIFLGNYNYISGG